MTPVLITADDLRSELGAADAPLVLDVRWTLDAPDGRPEYLAGHIPGAVYVSLEDELSAHGRPTDGRHPLPTRDALQASARRWGLSMGRAVVVYDANIGYSAARAWWLLRFAGVASVRILDGGLAAWVEAGGAIETGAVSAEHGDVQLGWQERPMIGLDEAAAFPSNGTLIDARAADRYRGDVEPLDPKPGHIPGAINIPTVANVGQDGRFLSIAELAERFAGLNPTAPIAVYCGSGVSAAHQIAALEIVGIEAALYPGSWSQWSNLDLPVETG